MKPWAVAHRGTPRRHPENTLPSFTTALRLGCDAIELDVQWTLDEVAVVYHDRTLAHAGGGRRRVHQLTLRELRRAATNYRIPTLQQTLDRIGNRTALLVELKNREGNHLRTPRLTAQTAKLLKRYRDSYLLSFDATLLAAAAEASPKLPRVLNVRPIMPGLNAKCREAQPQVICGDVRSLTRRFGQRVRRNGYQLWSFTINRPATLDRALDAGATAIISDRCDWLAEQLQRRGLR